MLKGFAYMLRGRICLRLPGFSGMDPEMRVSMGYSTMRQYAFGINLTF